MAVSEYRTGVASGRTSFPAVIRQLRRPALCDNTPTAARPYARQHQSTCSSRRGARCPAGAQTCAAGVPPTAAPLGRLRPAPFSLSGRLPASATTSGPHRCAPMQTRPGP